ncbi:hypothetical protein QCA50_010756 [Cerrena zonata]|uniref:Uncharacterized protein n=1 Tax=Cerrena zonata TaxID=2478898 RepID=A0AAW0FYS9_9APHY
MASSSQPHISNSIAIGAHAIENVITEVVTKALAPTKRELEQSQAIVRALKTEIDMNWKPQTTALQNALQAKNSEVNALKTQHEKEMSLKTSEIEQLKAQVRTLEEKLKVVTT